MFILVKGLLHTTMPKNLTDEQRTKRGQRRRDQRKRAEQRERAAQHAFYLPNIIDGFESQPCSVCGCDTRLYFSSLAHIALCSGKCEKLYAVQFTQFGLKLELGNKLFYKGQLYKFDPNILVINSDGEVCLDAWKPLEGVTASRVFIPLSQRDKIVQSPY